MSNLRVTRVAAVVALGSALGPLASCVTSSDTPTPDAGTPPSDAGLADTTLPPADSGPDAKPDTAPLVESGADAADAAPPPACDLTKPFGAPAQLMDLTSPLDDVTARLSADLLTAYIASDRTVVVKQIYTATRATATAAFGAATILPVVNFTGIDTERPSISGDERTLYVAAFTFGDSGTQNSRIYSFSRASKSVSFSAGVEVPATKVSGSMNQRDPYVTPDGSELYFCSDAQTQLDIYVSKNVAGTFGAATRITELASPTFALSCAPFLSADGLTIYFMSNRSSNSNDIWVARRAVRTDPFGTPTAVSELNTAENDEPSWLSADGCTLWYSTATDPTDSGTPRAHLFSVTKPK